ncbi:MAG: hypothetical protein AAFX76_12855, partial [Planctomycetota bacterium]
MASSDLIPLPPEIEVERLRNGERYVLPPRDMGPVVRRIAGGMALIGGLVVSGGFGLVAYTVYRLLVGSPFEIRLVAECMFGLPLFFVGLGMLNLGRKFRGGHNELVVTPEKLIAHGRPHLPGPKRKSVRLDHVDSLEISDSDELPLPDWLAPLRKLGGLSVKAGEKEFALAWGYPLEWLISLAQHVSEAAMSDLSTHERREPIPIAFENPKPDAEHPCRSARAAAGPNAPVDSPVPLAAPPEQPQASNAILKINRDGCAIELPARGIWKAGKGLIGFGVFWLTITTAVNVAFFWDGIGGSGLPVTMALFLIPLFGLFHLIGIAFLVGAYHVGRKRSFIDVVRGDVLVTTKGLFGLKQHTWNAGELRAVRVGESGTEVNSEPLMNLHFVGLWEVPPPEVGGREAFDRLDDLHPWLPPQVDMRFGYKPERPLYVVLVQAFRFDR